MVFGKQDTHVDRKGRTLIRDTLDDAGLTFTVSLNYCIRLSQMCCSLTLIVPRSSGTTCFHQRRIFERSMGCCVISITIRDDDGAIQSTSREGPWTDEERAGEAGTCLLGGKRICLLWPDAIV